MCYLYILILSLFRHIICKYFLLFHKLSFHFIDGFLCCVKAFKFNYVQIVYFCFNFICLERDIYEYITTIFVNVLPLFSLRSFFSFRSFIGIWVTLSLFLNIAWGNVLISLYINLSSFPSTPCWRDYPFSTEYSCLLCHILINHKCLGLEFFKENLFWNSS